MGLHLEQCHRILSLRGNLLLHLDWRACHYAKVVGDAVFGRNRFMTEIIWSYASGGASKRHLSRKHDNILWWTKTDEYTFNAQREPYKTPNVEGRKGFHPEGRYLTDVWDIPFISTTSKERTGYATQKPVKLLKRVVEIFSNPGDLILDPMAGSGTTGQAVIDLGKDRSALLVDRNPEAVRVMKERLT